MFDLWSSLVPVFQFHSSLIPVCEGSFCFKIHRWHHIESSKWRCFPEVLVSSKFFCPTSTSSQFSCDSKPTACVTEAFPTCQITHLSLKDGFKVFARIHPQSVGIDLSEELQADFYYNTWSYSVRILLRHYRRCLSHGAWQTAVGVYSSSKKNPGRKEEDLAPVAAILANIQPTVEAPPERPEEPPRPPPNINLDEIRRHTRLVENDPEETRPTQSAHQQSRQSAESSAILETPVAVAAIEDEEMSLAQISLQAPHHRFWEVRAHQLIQIKWNVAHSSSPMHVMIMIFYFWIGPN